MYCHMVFYVTMTSFWITNNVGLTFSVGDTTPQFTISVEQDDKNW